MLFDINLGKFSVIIFLLSSLSGISIICMLYPCSHPTVLGNLVLFFFQFFSLLFSFRCFYLYISSSAEIFSSAVASLLTSKSKDLPWYFHLSAYIAHLFFHVVYFIH